MKEIGPKPVYFYVAAALFIAAMIWGYFSFQRQIGTTGDIGTVFSSFNFFKNLSPFWLFVFIFLNNSIKALLVVVFGLLFGIFPLYFTYVNGALLGATISFALYRANLLVLIAGILPHGIFELPALIIAIAYGLWLGTTLVLGFSKKGLIQPAFKQSMKTYFRLILPLLLIGAIIEAFITPVLLNAALKTVQ